MPDRPDWGGPRELGQVLTDTFVLNATEAGAILTPAVAAVAGQRIVVQQLSAGPSPSAGGDLALRDWVELVVATIPGERLAAVTVSPQRPSDTAPITGDAAIAPVNTGLELWGRTRPGSGTQQVQMVLVYYLSV